MGPAVILPASGTSTTVAKRSMSEVGQTQKSGCSTGRSGLPSITDVVSQACQVRFVPPVSDVAPSFDPVIAPGEHEGLLASLFRIVPADPHIR